MKPNGKTVARPIIDEMIAATPNFYEKLKELISDEDVFKEVKCAIVLLEWVERFYELINSEHKGNLTPQRKRAEYERFYENVLDALIVYRPYLYSGEDIKLNIPPKRADTYNKLSLLLQDFPEAFKLIGKRYPYESKRKNKRELHNEKLEELSKRLSNPAHYLRYAKKKLLLEAKDKEYIFRDVFSMQALFFQDNNNNDYLKIDKLSITDIDGKIILNEGIDYHFFNKMSVVILPPMLLKCKDIKVTISTNSHFFKQISI